MLSTTTWNNFYLLLDELILIKMILIEMSVPLYTIYDWRKNGWQYGMSKEMICNMQCTFNKSIWSSYAVCWRDIYMWSSFLQLEQYKEKLWKELLYLFMLDRWKKQLWSFFIWNQCITSLTQAFILVIIGL